ncbi:MAG: hypothetical protein KGD65_17085 [Candidatus Lokiarchaeota archaeon]|nr:hypothetical protein [Candidatus Lokiarchaeota archaeon]
MAKYKFTQLERYAIYKAHEGKCLYTGELLDLRNFDIDHIIPESYLDNPDEYQRIKLEYDLKDDFKINSYYNWAPCHPYWNKKKHKTPFSKITTLTSLDLVRKKVPIILDIEKKIKRKAKKNEILANLGIQIEMGYLTKEEVNAFVKEISSYKIDDFELILSDIYLLYSNMTTLFKTKISEAWKKPNIGLEIEKIFMNLTQEFFKIPLVTKINYSNNHNFGDLGIQIRDNKLIPIELKILRGKNNVKFSQNFIKQLDRVNKAKFPHCIVILITPEDVSFPSIDLTKLYYFDDDLNKNDNLHRFKIYDFENFDVSIIHLRIKGINLNL